MFSVPYTQEELFMCKSTFPFPVSKDVCNHENMPNSGRSRRVICPDCGQIAHINYGTGGF